MSYIICRRRLLPIEMSENHEHMKNIEKSWKLIDAKPDFPFFKVSFFSVLRSASDAPWREDVDSRPEIAVRVLKVGFVNDLLFHKNCGPNVVFETLDFWPNFLHLILHLGLEK